MSVRIYDLSDGRLVYDNCVQNALKNVLCSNIEFKSVHVLTLFDRLVISRTLFLCAYIHTH